MNYTINQLIFCLVRCFFYLDSKNCRVVLFSPFNKASFAVRIKEAVRQNKGLQMGNVRILVHLPPILAELQNVAQIGYDGSGKEGGEAEENPLQHLLHISLVSAD